MIHTEVERPLVANAAFAQRVSSSTAMKIKRLFAALLKPIEAQLQWALMDGDAAETREENFMT